MGNLKESSRSFEKLERPVERLRCSERMPKAIGDMAQIFLGNELMKVDQKGRVGIPARFMSVLRALCPDQSESVGLMISPEKSIKIMPLPYFLEEVERWDRLDDMVASERMVKNLATGSAEMVTLDRQNRIKLNPLMLDLCEIRQQVVIVGSMHYMQLFDVDVWKTMFQQGLGQLGAALQAVAAKDRPAPQPRLQQIVINTADYTHATGKPPADTDSTERD